jgi:hypothetical protein
MMTSARKESLFVTLPITLEIQHLRMAFLQLNTIRSLDRTASKTLVAQAKRIPTVSSLRLPSRFYAAGG